MPPNPIHPIPNPQLCSRTTCPIPCTPGAGGRGMFSLSSPGGLATLLFSLAFQRRAFLSPPIPGGNLLLSFSLPLSHFYNLDRRRGSFPSSQPLRCSRHLSRSPHCAPAPLNPAVGAPPQPPAHPGPGPENAQAKPSSLFRKQGLRCEIQLVKKKKNSPAEQKQQTESSELPQVLCPSPTCSPLSGGCNYVSQGFQSGSFFFFPPSTSSRVLRSRSNPGEETKAASWQSFRHARLF